MGDPMDEIFYWSAPANSWALWERANRERHYRSMIRPRLPYQIVTRGTRQTKNRNAGFYHFVQGAS